MATTGTYPPLTTLPQDPKNDHYSENAFLAWFQRTLNITSIPLAIFILVCIALLILLLLISFIVCCCVCRRDRAEVKKRKRKAMTGIYQDEIIKDIKESKGAYGELEYSLEYQEDRNELKVGIIQCLQLPEQAGTDGLDPYVKLYIETENIAADESLIPRISKSKVSKTTTKADTCNPVWSENFKFKLPKASLTMTTVKFEVFDYDHVGQDIMLGIVEVPIKDLEILSIMGKRFESRVSLEPSNTEYTGLGDVCIILRQTPNENNLHVTILEAKKLSLPGDRSEDIPDVFVSVTLHIGKKRLSNKKTSARRQTREPYFSETMIFPIKASRLSVANLTCSLKYRSHLGVKKCLGRIGFGLGVHGAGPKKHWEDMLRNPNRAIAMWHTLDAPSAH